MALTLQTESPSVMTEWLQLETAVEVIGQVIAFYVGQVAQERNQNAPNVDRIQEWEQKIKDLGKERRACYRAATKEAIIAKAYSVYAPFIQEQSNQYA
ncbi:hypothetical protein GO730_37895 [Spirosoma sp. HMF3257]|nr:hypothetical protein [Spirosoma telluris]